ncbi:hypothetical protein PR048_028255 [Dryococelus australis]|uniref:Mutator-like transposase domain-containing protein n=1 Tax=Dryococelus australis TaxID=614101 RepID=A0ABQ9GIS5_9NEOP|nr:hypothetical protein PR048_028255 [Dryococelus australis]
MRASLSIQMIELRFCTSCCEDLSVRKATLELATFLESRNSKTAEVGNIVVSDLHGENMTSAASSNNAGTLDSASKAKLSNSDDAYSPAEHENGDVFESNVRFFYDIRAIGKGPTAAKLLCGILDLPQPPTRMNKYTEVIGTAVETVATPSVKTAVEEAIQINDGDKSIPVAFDGTWQKRGHASKNYVATVTSVDSRKVSDFEVLKKHCFKSNLPTEEHSCDKNYEGTSGEFLGDGYSKAHKRVVEEHPYKKKEIKKLNVLAMHRREWAKLAGDFHSYEHSIPEAVMEVGKPIYRNLTHPDLLRKCLHGKTQNLNESFNNLIWRRLPKNVCVGLKTLQWGVNDAVIPFNEGNFGIFKVLQEFYISPGPNALKTLKFLDKA